MQTEQLKRRSAWSNVNFGEDLKNDEQFYGNCVKT
jgi:hypothetical protein